MDSRTLTHKGQARTRHRRRDSLELADCMAADYADRAHNNQAAALLASFRAAAADSVADQDTVGGPATPVAAAVRRFSLNIPFILQNWRLL